MLNILLLKNLTEEIFSARFKQANLVRKTNFDNKLIRSDRKITLKKGKSGSLKKQINSLRTRDLFS